MTSHTTARFAPNLADLAAAKHAFARPSEDAEPRDYIDEHQVDTTIVPVAPRTGQPPLDAVRLLLSRSDRLLHRWAMNDRHIESVNDPVTREGATLLHIAARLYAKSIHAYDRKGAAYYSAATEALLAAGADPRATMHRDRAPGLDGTSSAMDDTPASVCDGCTPPSLRKRMLAEAAAGHIEVGDARRIERMIAHRQRRARDGGRAYGAVRRERHVPGLTEDGNCWVARSPTGEIVARVTHTGGDSRYVARSDAARALRVWRMRARTA
jgi:hypothetical protein